MHYTFPKAMTYLKEFCETIGENTADKKCNRTCTCIKCEYRGKAFAGFAVYAFKLLKKCAIM